MCDTFLNLGRTLPLRDTLTKRQQPLGRWYVTFHRCASRSASWTPKPQYDCARHSKIHFSDWFESSGRDGDREWPPEWIGAIRIYLWFNHFDGLGNGHTNTQPHTLDRFYNNCSVFTNRSNGSRYRANGASSIWLTFNEFKIDFCILLVKAAKSIWRERMHSNYVRL